MDLYRFFHPHHNPRLRQKGLRLQEISELEIAAKELHRALKRASLRMSSSESKISNPEISTQLLDSAADSVELAYEFLQNLTEAHPEDRISDLKNLLEERKSAAGWEAWTNLLTERLRSYNDPNCFPNHFKPEDCGIMEEIGEENPSEPSIIKRKATA